MHIPLDVRNFALPKEPACPLPSIISDTLRAARLRAGLKQKEVAHLIGISPGVYSRLERGRTLPSVPTLYRLCTVLEASPNELLGYPDALPPDVVAAAKDALRRRVHQLDGRQALALIQLLSGVR